MTDGSLYGRFAGRLNNYCVITDAERDWKRPRGAFCRGRGGRGGCAKDGSSWWASPAWVSRVALDLALSVLPRTAKLVMLHVISNEKENLRAEIDSADKGDGLQVEVIPFRQDDQPHPASKRNKHLRLSQPTNQYINHHSITIPPSTCNRTRNRQINHHALNRVRKRIESEPKSSQVEDGGRRTLVPSRMRLPSKSISPFAV